MALLQIKNITKNFGDVVALDGVSLDVEAGEVVVLLGPSGCGKSTLLRCVNGLEEINSGEIIFDGNNITASGTDWRLVRQKIGMVFQSYELFPHLNVLENIILSPKKVLKVPAEKAVREAETLLARIGLSDKIKAFPRELSGGQKQRVAIVRSLIMHPRILLLDEITAALDPEMVREVLDVVLKLAKGGQTLLIVTHEMEFAKVVADRVVFLDKGKIVEISTPHEFFNEPKTERAEKFLNIFKFDNANI
ncbi:MAG: amino acid ABC transporter ATP-binding protein [Oscillospiraceae bacterium]|nr:amino acid ABC transporter ATP-binding protein [Oscillospiraceae bacterium]